MNKDNEIVTALAAHAHTKWLETVPTATTKLKTIGNVTMNIAVPWAELHPSWKEVQKSTFWTYLDALKAASALAPLTLEQVAAQIHTVWMVENEWQRAFNPNLFFNYDSLSPAEQQKDLVIAQLILNFF